jgi:protoporphyrinogen oxidase
MGGGPAGLTAAWELTRAGMPVVVIEAGKIVGGISRTENYKGYRYDIGGHRFFTKVQLVQDWWTDILGDQFLVRPRLSRIYYKSRFFDYPLRPMNALTGLGAIEACRCMLSYGVAQAFPSAEERTLEQWVSNRFGRRLFEIFFKTYTEKVWGMPCSEISADWAAQRIKNLNLPKAIANAFFGSRGKLVTSLIDQFHYPRLGPGQMWQRVSDLLTEKGAPPRLETSVTAVHHDGERITAVTTTGKDGTSTREEGEHFISSLAVRDLINCLEPAPPREILEAANNLRYRDFLTVGLIVDQADPFPDNWIYIHAPDVKVGRIQNFKAWSPEMVPDPSKSSVGLEYFVQEGDEVWSAKDEDLVRLGTKELAQLGLVEEKHVVDGCVIRVPKAYPVYDDFYKGHLAVIREYLARFPNLQLVGRNGQHRYNNQDHSMVTAIYAARNVLGGSYDIWAVNVEADYHEEGADQAKEPEKDAVPKVADRLVPARPQYDARTALLRDAFSRFDPVALGAAIGVVAGLGLFLATAILLLKGGPSVGENLELLAQYLLGYRVSWTGAFLGLAEGGGLGFAIGYALARLMNGTVRWHEVALKRKLELRAALDAAAGDAD